MGMPLDAVTEAGALEYLASRISCGLGAWVITPNLEILRQYRGNPALRDYFHQETGGADLLVADGMPLIWASRLMRRALPERVPGSGLVLSLAKLAAEKKWSIFLLGGSPGAADRAAAVLQLRHRNLKIAGTCCPSPGFEKDPAQMAAIREQVVAAKPDIVYVALGFPKQERVAKELRAALPRAAFLGVGISLSFIAGEVKRAPRWVQRAGLEWLHRLAQEPRRLARRYLVHDIPFALFRLLPFALAARWNRDGGEGDEPRETRRAPLAPSPGVQNVGGRRNPAEPVEERDNHEGRHSRRRSGDASESADQSHQQAPAPRLRQADDRLPH